MDWAHRLACDGKHWREERQAKADLGTDLHALISAHLLGQQADTFLLSEETLGRFDLFRSWWSRMSSRFDVVACEQPMASTTLGYRGTPDVIVRERSTKRMMVLDWKSSSHVRLSHWVQVAAYSQLATETLRVPVMMGSVVRVLASGPTMARPRVLAPHWALFVALYAVHVAKRSIAQSSTTNADKEEGEQAA